jgi:hypothetical protein
MTPSQWIAAAVAVGLFGTSVYLAQEVRSLNDRLAKLDAALLDESKARVADIEGLQTRLKAESDRISALGTPETVAASIVETSLPKIIDGVAAALISDPNAVERLTGPQGPMPPIGQIAAFLLENDIVSVVADEIWTKHYDQIEVSPKLAATVAENVFRTYGAELKGADGRSPNPADVAAALAGEPAFLSLIELSRKPSQPKQGTMPLPH